eukprot:620805-Rhodomonas_salina.1
MPDPDRGHAAGRKRVPGGPVQGPHEPARKQSADALAMRCPALKWRAVLFATCLRREARC